MKVLPISKTFNSQKQSFKGYEQYFEMDMYGHYRFIDHPVKYMYPRTGTHSSYATDLIKTRMYPNGSIETTLGAFHPDMKDNVYFADPKEEISDEMRKKYDFIVYDNEPKYPHPDTVSTSYFGDGKTLYGDDYKNIRDYYYRLEMYDRKTLAELESTNNDRWNYKDLTEKIAYYKDRIAQSQYQQWQAEECRLKHEAARDLLNEKFKTERDLDRAKLSLHSAPEVIERQDEKLRELNAEKQGNDGIVTAFRKKLANYLENQRINKTLDEKDLKTSYIRYDENDNLKKQISDAREELGIYREKARKIAKDIIDCKKYRALQPKIITEYPKKIADLEKQLADIKARLIPLFDDLKGYYIRQNIIKGVKW